MRWDHRGAARPLARFSWNNGCRRNQSAPWRCGVVSSLCAAAPWTGAPGENRTHMAWLQGRSSAIEVPGRGPVDSSRSCSRPNGRRRLRPPGHAYRASGGTSGRPLSSHTTRVLSRTWVVVLTSPGFTADTPSKGGASRAGSSRGWLSGARRRTARLHCQIPLWRVPASRSRAGVPRHRTLPPRRDRAQASGPEVEAFRPAVTMRLSHIAPPPGLEPGTCRLTAECSAI